MKFTAVYYEPDSLQFPLGQYLHDQYADLPWHPIESHNRIPALSQRENKDFPALKRLLILGTRKTHRYVPNHKISDYLVPFTSSGCTAMCLYCYLVCHYNKCSYLRLFVNREQMLERLLAASHRGDHAQVFEIGSNSDLILENTITHNLEWVIPAFAKHGRGSVTFPTKFDKVGPLLGLEHRGKTLFRMSVNPSDIISRVELGTSPLTGRLDALVKMAEAGYPVGILIAPVILLPGWEGLYGELLTQLADRLPEGVRRGLSVEVIFMTYSYVHRAINREAFPGAPNLFDRQKMTGRGRGKYAYRNEIYRQAEKWFCENIPRTLPGSVIKYIS